MSNPGNTIFCDHRAEPCEPFPLRGRLFDFLYRVQLPSDVAGVIRARILLARRKTRSASWGWVRWLGYAMFAWVLLVAASRLLLFRATADGVKLLIAAILLPVFALAIGSISRFARWTEIVPAFLAQRRCPSCAYDLSATIPDADGCTTCPECGAAWRLSEAIR